MVIKRVSVTHMIANQQRSESNPLLATPATPATPAMPAAPASPLARPTTRLQAPCLLAPIVLVHGFFGFDVQRIGRFRVRRYWPGIVPMLRRSGNRVLVARLAPTDSISHRARQLQAFIESHLPDGPLHLIAHSMGGLDCRYALTHLGLHQRVLSLTTINSPHQGSALADFGVKQVEGLMKLLFAAMGLTTRGVYDLTREACQRFNETTPDVPGVVYHSVASSCSLAALPPQFIGSYLLIQAEEGANDGLVSTRSAARWPGTEHWRAAHTDVVNWPNVPAQLFGQWCDPLRRYVRLIERLAALGF
jgi:triacylglycerol lipase